MPLIVEGPEIDDLVARYCRLTGQTDTSEAVRQALADQIAVLSAHQTLAGEVARIQQRAADAGFVSGKRDDKADKAFMDDQWGEGWPGDQGFVGPRRI